MASTLPFNINIFYTNNFCSTFLYQAKNFILETTLGLICESTKIDIPVFTGLNQNEPISSNKKLK